jgi:hypothetical protein
VGRRRGVAGLRIRIVEHWEYTVGGHLQDDLHYDGGSVLTIVTALNDECAQFSNASLHAVVLALFLSLACQCVGGPFGVLAMNDSGWWVRPVVMCRYWRRANDTRSGRCEKCPL